MLKLLFVYFILVIYVQKHNQIRTRTIRNVIIVLFSRPSKFLSYKAGCHTHTQWSELATFSLTSHNSFIFIIVRFIMYRKFCVEIFIFLRRGVFSCHRPFTARLQGFVTSQFVAAPLIHTFFCTLELR